MILTYLEFFAGVGGWSYALEYALRNVGGPLDCQLLAAFDHSDLCKSVFAHNHQSNKKLFHQTPIERVTREQLEKYSAHVWCMSPPCQPHTRQHSNQQCELDDPRSKSFLHLCQMIESMEVSTLPCLILLENVIGFELSGIATNHCGDTEAQHAGEIETNEQEQPRRGSFQTFRNVLAKRQYRVAHFHLDPTDVGIPNARPRHYTIAFRQTTRINDDSISNLVSNDHDNLFTNENLEKAPIIHGPQSLGTTSPALPCIGDFLDASCKDEPLLRIPKKVWSSSSAWCFDVVTALHHRSACFTHSYGKFVRGTGSILYTRSLDIDEKNGNRKRDRATAFLASTRFDLEAPEGRHFDADWSQDIDWEKEMRYLSGTEIARLMGFPVARPAAVTLVDSDVDSAYRKFSFPDTTTVKQQWKLLGNSLNVKVAGKMAEIGVKCLLLKR